MLIALAIWFVIEVRVRRVESPPISRRSTVRIRRAALRIIIHVVVRVLPFRLLRADGRRRVSARSRRPVLVLGVVPCARYWRLRWRCRRISAWFRRIGLVLRAIRCARRWLVRRLQWRCVVMRRWTWLVTFGTFPDFCLLGFWRVGNVDKVTDELDVVAVAFRTLIAGGHRWWSDADLHRSNI